MIINFQAAALGQRTCNDFSRYLLHISLFINLIFICLFFVSCRQAEKAVEVSPSAEKPAEVFVKPEKTLASEELARNFPLLPVIEKRQWRELLEAEKTSADQQLSAEEREKAATRIETIAHKLEKNHPFKNEADRLVLGGITFFKETRTIEIPATVNYPDEGDTRHPDELELILCSEKGRTHETLFVTQARPLHLELLLHLAGFTKSPRPSFFQISVVSLNHEPIPIAKLIRAVDGDALPAQLTWEFSGSEFDDFYSPDQTGDFAILWHAHPSVLRIRHEKIASGEIKLAAVKHKNLQEGIPVTIVISPVKIRS